MLLRLLKNNRTEGIIFITFLMILLWLKCFLHPQSMAVENPMPFYELIFNGIAERKILFVVISMLYMALVLLLLIRLNMIHYLLEERSFMPAIFYLMISATFPTTQLINPVLVSSPFLLMAIQTLLKGEEHRADPMALFRASLILMAGSIFFLKIIWFIPFLWITAAIIRPVKWRGFVNPFIALIMMAIFYITYYWVFRNDLSLFSDLLKSQLDFTGSFMALKKSEWFLLSYLLILLTISSLYLLDRFQKKKIIIRKIYQVLFFLFIYSLLFFVFISGFSIQVLSLLAIPLAYLLAHFFHRRKNHWIHEAMLWIWLLLIAYNLLRIAWV